MLSENPAQIIEASVEDGGRPNMSHNAKLGAIILIGLTLAVALYIYLSPYQQCVRASTDEILEWSDRLGTGETKEEAIRSARISCSRK